MSVSFKNHLALWCWANLLASVVTRLIPEFPWINYAQNMGSGQGIQGKFLKPADPCRASQSNCSKVVFGAWMASCRAGQRTKICGALKGQLLLTLAVRTLVSMWMLRHHTDVELTCGRVLWPVSNRKPLGLIFPGRQVMDQKNVDFFATKKWYLSTKKVFLWSTWTFCQTFRSMVASASKFRGWQMERMIDTVANQTRG